MEEHNKDFFCYLRDFSQCKKCKSGLPCDEPRHVFEYKGGIYVVNAKAASTSIIKSIPGGRRQGRPIAKLLESKKFKFSFVRNPYTRLVSCWQGWIRSKKGSVLFKRHPNLRLGMSFKEFAFAVSDIDDLEANEHYVSQTKLLTRDGELIVDFFGKFETIGKDWKKLKKHINLTALKYASKGSINNHMSLYDKETLDVVYKRFKDDFEYFGYKHARSE